MTTLTQAAYNILNQLRGGRSTNSEQISLEQVKYWVLYYRALLIRRDEERLSRVEDLSQKIAVEMQSSNQTWAQTTGQTFPTPGSNVPRFVLRSAAKLPEIVRLRDRPAIQHVFNTDSLTAIPLIDVRRAMWNQYDKYSPTSRRCWYNNGYLWVSNWEMVNPEAPPTIDVQAIFESPETAFNYDFGMTTPWDDDVDAFPISADLLQQVTQAIINTEGKTVASTPTDHTLDNLPDKPE